MATIRTARTTDKHTVSVRPIMLSDGSEVYTVRIRHGADSVDFDAVDRAAAFALAEQMHAAIERHALAFCEFYDLTRH